MNWKPEKTCFVAMPIGSEEDGTYEQWKQVYENVIKPAVEKGAPDLACFRADEESSVGTITKDIIEHLKNDFLCIVDVTGQNANVYYELGLRDSWHNRTIIITQDRKDIRFDKKDDRTFKYHETDIQKIRAFEVKIAKCIEDILSNPDKSRNRVQEFLGQATGSTNQAHINKRAIVDPQGFSLIQRIQDVLRVSCDNQLEDRILPHGVIGSYTADNSKQEVTLTIVMPEIDTLQPVTRYVASFKDYIRQLKSGSYVTVVFADSGFFGGTLNWSAVERVKIIVPNDLAEAEQMKLKSSLSHHYSEVIQFKDPDSVFGNMFSGGGWYFPLEDGSATIELWDSKMVAQLEEKHHLTA